jgi:hypothetical protein
VSVLEARPSKPKSYSAIVYFFSKVINQEDKVVTNMKLVNLLLRRSEESGE